MSLTRWHNQWPGGILSFVRRYQEPVEDVEAATCAWRRFVRAMWVDGTDADQQRRALVERWVAVDQEFRNNYERRAPVDEPPFEDHKNLDEVYVWISQWTPETQALLAKCILSLFGLDCGDNLLATKISVLMPFDENEYHIVDNFKFLQSVTRPNFLDMHITQHGTVLFANSFPKLIIDDHTL
ncbi:hypothetical protein N7451_002337 [Penicillium sp. IBT 35674x]|nr:hypothetical protein N7451_002337 [Penicillium sp. IBT 35674x]